MKIDAHDETAPWETENKMLERKTIINEATNAIKEQI